MQTTCSKQYYMSKERKNIFQILKIKNSNLTKSLAKEEINSPIKNSLENHFYIILYMRILYIKIYSELLAVCSA